MSVTVNLNPVQIDFGYGEGFADVAAQLLEARAQVSKLVFMGFCDRQINVLEEVLNEHRF
jgi:hypothetical protein